jgi:hypothetical protein
MSKSKGRSELPYEVRARIADNLFLQRRRAEYSQGELAEKTGGCARHPQSFTARGVKGTTR